MGKAMHRRLLRAASALRERAGTGQACNVQYAYEPHTDMCVSPTQRAWRGRGLHPRPAHPAPPMSLASLAFNCAFNRPCFQLRRRPGPPMPPASLLSIAPRPTPPLQRRTAPLHRAAHGTHLVRKVEQRVPPPQQYALLAVLRKHLVGQGAQSAPAGGARQVGGACGKQYARRRCTAAGRRGGRRRGAARGALRCSTTAQGRAAGGHGQVRMRCGARGRGSEDVPIGMAVRPAPMRQLTMPRARVIAQHAVAHTICPCHAHMTSYD